MKSKIHKYKKSNKNFMSKNSVLKIYFLLFSIVSMAQQEVNTEFAAKMDLAFQALEKNRVPHGLLKDYAFEFTELSAYNGVVTDTNYVTPVCIKQIYNTLLMARIHANASQFITPQEYEQRWQANRSVGVITLSGLLYNYSQFKTDAVTSGKLQVINNQFKDKYVGTAWQNPYDTKQTFAIAPSVRSYKGYNLSIKIPQNLWLTNITQTVQSIQIDANDGLGYRTITFGQNLSVAYTTSGMKHWYYKVTLSNGQIVYSHSKISIEEGLVTIPHINSSGGSLYEKTALTNSSALGRTNITATLPYNGSYGSAKVVIDYASADRKIRRPLIVAEGFDQGALTNPEEEFGITSYADFKFIIGNSQSGQLQSLLTDINTKQYDIIWVDWNNGTDYIQKNAYVLEEVIKWANAEKLANGSSQSNVVLGASMGGLIARYALKDMEDRSLPTQTSLYISHDAPHQGANFPIGYQYMSRHALHQYVKSPLLLLGGEIVLPLFTDGVTPLDLLLLQNTPAARQMLINYVGINYGIINTAHDTWQTELRTKGYPSMRKIAISNGNHCAVPQNAPAGTSLLSINGNYSTGWLTDIVLTAFPGVNTGVFQTLSVLTAEPGFLFGILPGGNKIKLDFKVNSLPSSGANQLYKGKITYTKKLLWLIDINVTITDKSFNSPSGTLPFDYYPGGAIETGIRNSATASGGSFWQQALVKYKMNITTEPSFCFIPAASALDIGLGNVALDNSDYLKKYNKTVPLVAPKTSPFDNFTTSYQNSFTLNYDDNFQSTNEHHIYLHLRNANWLAKEIDNVVNNNDVFDCTYMCSDAQIMGITTLCNSATYFVSSVATYYNWIITEGSNLVTLSGNNTANLNLTWIGTNSGFVTMSVTFGDNWARCGNVTLTKRIWVGKPSIDVNLVSSSNYADVFLVGSLNSNLQQQGITNIKWEQLSSEDGGHFSGAVNSYIARGFGPNYYWYCDARVTATNACGSTVLDFGVACASPPPCDETYTIQATSKNSYEANVVIDPCATRTMAEVKKATDKEITSAQLFDIYGAVARTYMSNNFYTNNLRKGIYILKVQVKEKMITKKIIVE
jgi:hypothetical protein